MRLTLVEGGIDGDEVELMNEMGVLFRGFSGVKIWIQTTSGETTPLDLKLSPTILLVFIRILDRYARFDWNCQFTIHVHIHWRKSLP